jgi:hypothetical protein
MRNRASIREVLMKRDGMTFDEATDLIQDAKTCMEEYLDEGDTDGAYNICQEFFGLEPDYLNEMI